MRVLLKITTRAMIKTTAVLACSVLLPTAAFAQASIAGSVTDPSRAVLPGVTVEAASPVLIEKARTAVTDGTGQYRIEDLRPGSYTVTFTLSGFRTLRREDVQLRGTLIVGLDVQLEVGALEETVTVTGENPIVDVRSTRREMTLENSVLKSIPSIRSYSALTTLVPGVQTDRNNVATGPNIAIFPIHGGLSLEPRLLVDGLNVGLIHPGYYIPDIGNAAEVSITTSGGLGEQETAGLTMNVVPKTGGNTVSGAFFFSGLTEGMQSGNFTEELRARGLVAPTPLSKVYEINPSVGGPIVRDRVWYFVNARTQGQTQNTPNLFYNKNAGDPTKWTYEPDLSRPAYADRTWENVGVRLTWQVTPRNKISSFWDEQAICRKCTGTISFTGSPNPTVSPEADGHGENVPLRVQQVTWTSPVSNRLLLEAAAGTSYFQWGVGELRPNPTHDLVRVTELGGTPITQGVILNGMQYRSQNWLDNAGNNIPWKVSASYVTGAHSVKVGYKGNYRIDDRHLYTNTKNLQYFLFNGTPNSLQMYISPFEVLARAATTSLYAQEQWTRGRLTLQGAIRYDQAHSWFPAQSLGPTRFLPTQLSFPETKGVDAYHDITPRMGVAYDLLGDGKTGFKVNLGKYLTGADTNGDYYNSNPTLRIPGGGGGVFNPSITRSWVDVNGNFGPDCDLLNPAAQNLAASGGDICGAYSDQNFGTSLLSNTYDPDLLRGSGVRPSDWSLGASIQREIVPRASVEVAYHRRWFSGFTVIDNRAVSPSAFDQFSITAPQDARLPGGGGQVIQGLYNVKPALFGQTDNLVTSSRKYGDQYRYFNGVDVTFNVRAVKGFTFQGGTSTGQLVQDSCEIRARLPETAPLNPYCHTASGFLTQFRGLAVYTIPRIDVQVSTVYQDKPGSPGIDASLAANYNAPFAAYGPSLGRFISGGNANSVVTVNLVEPGTLYGDRIRQLDVRGAKTLTFGRTKVSVGVDFYNVLNTNVTLRYGTTFVPGGAWLTPAEIMSARMARFTAEFIW
jgi:hypothetical protein